MALVSLTSITNGSLADASVVMANYNAIVNQINGNIDGANIKNGVITAPKLDTSISALFLAADGVSRKVAQGGYLLTWNGATSSTNLVIPHGLPSVPNHIITTSTLAGFSPVLCNAIADATNLTISVVVPIGGSPPNLTQTTIWWECWV
jgi:hypothetical protein